MKEHLRQIFAGLAGAVVLVVLVLATNFAFWFDLLIAGLTGLGTYFTIPRKKSDEEIEVAPGVSRAQLDRAAEQVENYIRKFAREEQKCPGIETRRTIAGIRTALEKIGENFRQDPGDLNLAHQFLNQYLEKSFAVVSQYNRLASMARDDRLSEQLGNVEKSIDRIKLGFDGFYRKCLENDLYNLEVESETLNAILEMDQPFLDVEERSRT